MQSQYHGVHAFFYLHVLIITRIQFTKLSCTGSLYFYWRRIAAASVKKLKRLFPNASMINSYGPTEATVVVTYIEITNEIVAAYPQSLPIG